MLAAVSRRTQLPSGAPTNRSTSRHQPSASFLVHSFLLPRRVNVSWIMCHSSRVHAATQPPAFSAHTQWHAGSGLLVRRPERETAIVYRFADHEQIVGECSARCRTERETW